MSDFQYCRACLVTDVKMLSVFSNISSVISIETYSKILEIPVAVHEHLFCIECANFLAKFEEFRSKCCRAQSILSSIKFQTEDTKEIYTRIQNIDRKQNRLISNLALSNTENHNNEVPLTIYNSKPETCDEDVFNLIKSEITDNEHYDDRDYIATVHEPESDYTKTNRKKEFVKFKRKHKTQHIHESSDDEPLAKKVTRTKDNLNNEDKKYKTKDITIPEPGNIHNSNEMVKTYKKSKVCDLEEYATVIYLTSEEAKKEVLLRKRSSNYINSPLKCNLCYRGYEAKAAFENHMKKHSVEYGKYQCDICQLRFPEQRYLCKHRLASHKRKFCCKICPYICFCMHQAKTHISLHKGKKYPCKECHEVFSMPNSLLMHKRQKHATECVCELCGHTFATPRGLYSHHVKLHRQHVNEKLGPKCVECNKHFATEKAWKIHLVLSSRHNVSNGCKFCGDAFGTSQDLKSHQRMHARKHVRRNCGDLPALCSMCDKWLHDRTEYKMHMSSSHPHSEAVRNINVDTPFVCEICGKMFKKQCFLTYHQRKHTGERPYKCGDCNKTFQLAGALSTHRAVHLNKRTHKCGICARVFTFKSVLNKHMKVHLGIRPHRCDICNKSFISPCDVKVHIKYVHNKVPWPKRDRTKSTELNYIQY